MTLSRSHSHSERYLHSHTVKGHPSRPHCGLLFTKDSWSLFRETKDFWQKKNPQPTSEKEGIPHRALALDNRISPSVRLFSLKYQPSHLFVQKKFPLLKHLDVRKLCITLCVTSTQTLVVGGFFCAFSLHRKGRGTPKIMQFCVFLFFYCIFLHLSKYLIFKNN